MLRCSRRMSSLGMLRRIPQGAEEDRPVYAGGMRSGLGSGEAAVASREDARM
jgi:hypothetical protein